MLRLGKLRVQGHARLMNMDSTQEPMYNRNVDDTVQSPNSIVTYLLGSCARSDWASLYVSFYSEWCTLVAISGQCVQHKIYALRHPLAMTIT